MNQLKIISEKEVENIHSAALWILGKTGLKIHHHSMLNELSAAGFKVDQNQKRVWFQTDLVEEYLQKAPREFVLLSRSGKHDLPITANKIHTRTISGSFKLMQSSTRRCRTSTAEDTARIVRLVDALENISFCGGILYPWTEEPLLRDIALIKIMFENTEKHLFFQPYGRENLKYILEMADIIGTGSTKPKGSLITVNISPTSPLQYAENELDILIEAAEREIPVQIGSTPLAGAACPVTIAGQLTVAHAEILATVVMGEVINAGAPMIYEPRPNPLDMRSGNALWGNVEWGLASAAFQQLALRCNLPTDLSGATTESKLPDQQAGIEKCMNMMLIALARPNIVSGIGILETINATSFEQLVIDDEICARVFRILRGIEVNEETIAAELIDKVGPGGSFLGEDHTFQHYRNEFIWDTIFDRNVYDRWQKEGARDLAEVARDRAEKIISEHTPARLSAEVTKELDKVFERAKAGLLQ